MRQMFIKIIGVSMFLATLLSVWLYIDINIIIKILITITIVLLLIYKEVDDYIENKKKKRGKL